MCLEEGCGRETYCKGMCRLHYLAAYRQSETYKSRKSFYYKKNNKSYRETKKGREAYRKGQQTYRARKRGAVTESFNNSEIYERDNWLCGICGNPVNSGLEWPHPGSPTLDHIIPLSRGGNHTRGNVQLAHMHCNLVKNDKLPEEL